MFNNKKLEDKIVKEIGAVAKDIKDTLDKDNKEFKDEYYAVLKKHDSNIADLSIAFDRLKVEVDQKLVKNNQEYSDKLFELMSAFLRWNKEISLVSFLGGKEPDLKKLKTELMRPMIEEGWNKTNAEQADKINKALSSKGEKIRQAWEKYKDDKLTLEREGKDTKLVDSKLEILNKLMEGVV
jgi:hypothetical protein